MSTPDEPSLVPAPAAFDEPRRVLLADDDPVTSLITRRLLERAGYAVTSVADGGAALSALRAQYYPVLLTDWQLPVLDGLGVISAVRSGDWPGYVYTILLTGRDSRESLLRGLAAGADDYLTKPVDGAELLARMKTAWRIGELEQRLRRAHEEAVKLSLTDPLTSLSNRRHFNAILLAEIARAQRFNHPLSVVICDVDYFKRTNDLHGHAAGDAVLRELAAVLAANVRSRIDGIARLGGEEFALVLPESALDVTGKLTERLRAVIEALEVRFEGSSIRLTASFGAVAVEPPWPSGLTSVELLASADHCLYQAKQAGRNRVCLQQVRRLAGQ